MTTAISGHYDSPPPSRRMVPAPEPVSEELPDIPEPNGLPEEPTMSRPGSEERIGVYHSRYAAGKALNHDDDYRDRIQPGITMTPTALERLFANFVDPEDDEDDLNDGDIE